MVDLMFKDGKLVPKVEEEIPAYPNTNTTITASTTPPKKPKVRRGGCRSCGSRRRQVRLPEHTLYAAVLHQAYKDIELYLELKEDIEVLKSKNITISRYMQVKLRIEAHRARKAAAWILKNETRTLGFNWCVHVGANLDYPSTIEKQYTAFAKQIL